MNNINKTIKGVSLLTDINLALESGHIYGFVGDNGSGKTVLFKVLLGLMHKTSGTILVDGREQKDLMQDVGFIIERPEYIPYYSAKKNLEIIAAYRKVQMISAFARYWRCSAWTHRIRRRWGSILSV